MPSARRRSPLGPALLVVTAAVSQEVVVSTRRSAWLSAILALAGVALLSLTGVRVGHLDPVGWAFAAVAGASWAGYILASARVASDFADLDALALATAIGAVRSARDRLRDNDGRLITA